MGSGGWQQQKCTHLCSLHCHRSNGVPTSLVTISVHRVGRAAQRRQQRAGDVSYTANHDDGFPNHCPLAALQKGVGFFSTPQVFSAFIRFWDHPPTTTAWGKLVKGTRTATPTLFKQGSRQTRTARVPMQQPRQSDPYNLEGGTYSVKEFFAVVTTEVTNPPPSSLHPGG